MWRKMINLYDDIEREQLAVLERPELASTVAPGCRAPSRSPMRWRPPGCRA